MRSILINSEVNMRSILINSQETSWKPHGNLMINLLKPHGNPVKRPCKPVNGVISLRNPISEANYTCVLIPLGSPTGVPNCVLWVRGGGCYRPLGVRLGGYRDRGTTHPARCSGRSQVQRSGPRSAAEWVVPGTGRPTPVIEQWGRRRGRFLYHPSGPVGLAPPALPVQEP